MNRHLGATVALAVTGLVLALALAVLASRLSTQHIGLAGEHGSPAQGLARPVNAPGPTAPAATATGASGTTSAPAGADGRERPGGEPGERSDD